MTNGDYYPQEVPYAMPVPESRSSEFERWRFDIEDILTEQMYNFAGYIWDKDAKDGQGDWVSEGNERINKKGASVFISEMRVCVNKISTLTQLNIDEVFMEIKSLHDRLNRLILINHDDWDIKDPSEGYALLWATVFFAFNGLKQSEGAATMKAITESGKTMRHVYVDEGHKQQGFLHIPGRGKKE